MSGKTTPLSADAGPIWSDLFQPLTPLSRASFCRKALQNEAALTPASDAARPVALQAGVLRSLFQRHSAFHPYDTNEGHAMNGQRVGYKRVSTIDQNSARQLEGVSIDKCFEDKASGKDMHRPELQAALLYCREADTLICHSMDRLARSIVDLRAIVNNLTSRGVAVEFVKENLRFTGDDSPVAILLLSLIGAVAEFERSMILERQREGIALAKAAGKYKGRKPILNPSRIEELKRRADSGEPKASLAREYGISRETLYSYLRVGPKGTNDATAQRDPCR